MQDACTRTVDVAIPLPHLLKPDLEPPPSPSPLATMAPSQDELKRVAAHRAVELVESGMVIGLGTGSTAAHALDRIGDLIRSGALRDVVGIPTSEWAAARAAAAGIPLSDLNAHPVVDLSIDGADEVDPALNLVKGRGGSLLREKMVEGTSRRFVVIVDDSKLVPRLAASGLAVPVEIIPFGWALTLRRLQSLFDGVSGFNLKLRTASINAKATTFDEKGWDSEPFVTDNKNYIADLFFENGIHGDLRVISDAILRITGVVEHGLFLGLASSVVVAQKDGVVVVKDKEATSNGM
ncbi:probable ribose-5-phosphate isomerase 1 [Musa acuminata AAA Group]|uniref:probable ribose-5-phosphate isomerase 1 n=1 Tax=Musa acuminata AAA Group TaxID=214697 RepID=UPI0031DAF68C